MTSSILTKSVNGLPIWLHQFGKGSKNVLILAGVHGDEIEGVIAAEGLLAELAQAMPFQLTLTLIPRFNVDGVIAQTRSNANDVDLNRNLPTKDWTGTFTNPRYKPGPAAASEPENKALIQWLDQNKPQLIISLHSWKPMINVNGGCEAEAQAIHSLTNYRIDADIGYPTPGSLGTYAGLERKWPTITYEIERGSQTKQILPLHVPALLKALAVTEKK